MTRTQPSLPPDGVRAAVHAELTADGERIILMGAGDQVVIADLAKRLTQATPLFKKSSPPGALVTAATWATVIQLTALLGPAFVPGPQLCAWIELELGRRTTPPPARLAYQPPGGCVPRQYQVDGASLLAVSDRGAMLFDDPGTGKTITAILGLLERSPFFMPTLVIAPASVVDPWVDAWRAWGPPNLRTVAYRGTPKKRHPLLGTADVYVTSYDTARVDGASKDSPLMKLAPAYVVIDECHLIKNPHAMRSLAARRLAKKADTVVALSGTPITHHPGDLWPTLEGMEPLAYPSRERFITRYCLTIPADYDDGIVGLRKDTEPEFRLSLQGSHRRVAKADVLDQLPPKVYTPRYVDLPPAWRKVYDRFEAEMIAALPNDQELSVMSVLHQLTRLSQLASAAAVDVREIPAPTPDEPDKVKIEVTLGEPCWKADALLEVIAERPGQPVVSFAPSRQLTVLAGKRAEAEGYRVGYIVGGQSMTDRTNTRELFQAGKLDLLAATTGAGGVGLTLTAANTAVFLQRPWSLVEALQAEDRLHRIGAEHHESIEIIDVIAKNTVDTRVRQVLREKAGQLSDLLQDPRIVRDLLGGTKSQKGK